MQKFFHMSQYYPEPDKLKLVLHTRHGKEIIDPPFDPYCYIEGNGEEGIKDALTHKRLQKVSFKTPSEVGNYRYKVKTWESDVPYERRVMLDMDWKIDDVPKAWVDIETDDSKGAPDARESPITAIGIIFDDGREVFLYDDEETMLNEFMELMKDIGMIITYNGGEDVWETRSFDMPYLATRYGIVVKEMDAHAENVKFPFDEKMRHCAFLDIYQIYKYETARVGKSLAGGLGLDNVCMHELGMGKITRDKKFSEMTKEEMKVYNMRDVQLLRDLDQKFHFTDLKIGLAQLTNLNLVSWRKNRKKRELTPLVMTDQLILKESKKVKLAWPYNEYSKGEGSIIGALVLQPKPGLYHGIQNFDVKQMYPNIMINERISPDKDRIIVPNILIDLKKRRVELKNRWEKTKSTEDYITQYNYKVLANVFYGAIGNAACRVYSRSMAQAITMKGRRILTKIKELCEGAGFDVVYGDTDSVFTNIPKEKVPILLKIINRRIEPYEVEAGEYYKSILYVGDKDGGTKKRYAGIEEDGKMKTVGVEAVRRDYCQLSRETQLWALGAILNGRKQKDILKCMENLHKAIKTGVYDEFLVISKGVKKLEDYNFKTKTGGVHRGLPHVRALKMAYEKGFKNFFDIQFVYTIKDVEPVLDKIPKNIDYDLYYERQLFGVVKPLLRSLGLQNGDWREPKKMKKRKTQNQSLLVHMSS